MHKGLPGWVGRLADARHVATLTLTICIALGMLAGATRLAGEPIGVTPAGVALGLAVNALTHWWADRRETLRRLAEAVGKGEFYRLGAPRPGRDDAPHIGTGAYALDQSFHIGWLFATALIIATV